MDETPQDSGEKTQDKILGFEDWLGVLRHNVSFCDPVKDSHGMKLQ